MLYMLVAHAALRVGSGSPTFCHNGLWLSVVDGVVWVGVSEPPDSRDTSRIMVLESILNTAKTSIERLNVFRCPASRTKIRRCFKAKPVGTIYVFQCSGSQIES